MGSIYRPSSNHPTLTPNEQFEQSIELLSNLLSDLTSVYDEIYIFGDLNIDVLKYSSCKFATEYVDLLFSFGLLQTVTKPTRCTINSATLIDHAIVLPKPQPFESVILVSKVSDHFPVILFGNSVAPKKPLKEVTSRDFSEANINKFKRATSSFNWNFVTDINDTQEAFSSFSNVFHNLYNLHFPLVTTKFNKNHHQIEKWMSKGILISRSTKLKLAKNCLISPSLENNLKYKSYRNVYNTTIRGAKKLYFEKELKRAQSDFKKTWAILKKAINKQNYKSSTMDCLKIDNVLVSDPKLMANNLNIFFTSVAQKIVDEIHPTDRPPDIAISNDVPLLNFSDCPVTCTEIIETFDLLQPKKSQDLNGLSMFVIKKLSFQLAKPLCHIANLSLTNENC